MYLAKFRDTAPLTALTLSCSCQNDGCLTTTGNPKQSVDHPRHLKSGVPSWGTRALNYTDLCLILDSLNQGLNGGVALTIDD